MKDKENKYSDEVLKILTNGLGVELGKPIRIRYYDLKKRLFYNDYAESRLDNKENIQIALDLIALSIYYQNLIVPFYGSLKFYDKLTNFDVNSIAMGAYSFNSEDRNRMETCTKAFFSIMKKVRLSPSDLVISDVKDIFELIEREEVDWEEFDE